MKPDATMCHDGSNKDSSFRTNDDVYNKMAPLHCHHQHHQKSVQFDDDVTMICYETDARLRKHIWYRKTDYKRFHLEKKETLRHFRHAQSRFQCIQEDVFCLRGFEACLSVRAVQQKLLRKVAALQAVLETQFDQRRRHVVCDPRRIQVEYHRVSTPSRHQALERAALDAMEVDKDCSTDDKQLVESEDMTSLKSQIDHLLHIKSGGRQPSLRSATSGPLRLRKTVPSTA